MSKKWTQGARRHTLWRDGEMVLYVGSFMGEHENKLTSDEVHEMAELLVKALNEKHVQDTLAAARVKGEQRGRGAASWVFDGNTTMSAYERVVNMIDDGDPMLVDVVQEPAWLSGAAGESIQELLGELCDGLDYDERRDVEDAYESAASEAFQHEVERVARLHTEGQ